MKTVRVGFAELGLCPAAVRMNDGVIEVNADVWNRYDQFERAFILAHEEGHYRLQTDSETEADVYALHKCYKMTDKSLKRSIETLYKVGIVNEARYNALYIEALKLDWQTNGNVKAKQELEKLKITKMNNKMTLSSTPFVQYKRMDGNEDQNEVNDNVVYSKENYSHCHRRQFLHCVNGCITGVEIKRFYFSWETMLLLLLSILFIYQLKR